MSVGMGKSKQELDALAGDITREFQKRFNDVLTLKGYLDGADESELEGMGYTPQDVATLKTAWADLFQLTQIWTGAASLASPKDFRVFVKQLWGIGSF